MFIPSTLPSWAAKKKRAALNYCFNSTISLIFYDGSQLSPKKQMLVTLNPYAEPQVEVTRMDKAKRRVQISKVSTRKDIKDSAAVMAQVFEQEKGWLNSSEHAIPESIASDNHVSWFLARVNGTPAGLLRLVYDPSLQLPPECLPTFEPGIDLETLAASGRFVEIGRFMIVAKFRHDISIALRLMRKAVREVVERDYTHFVTDVFENEPNSPFKFHTRILGFEVIGRHVHGELNCNHTRIILVLNILKAYRRFRERNNAVYTFLTRGFRRLMNQKLALARSM